MLVRLKHPPKGIQLPTRLKTLTYLRLLGVRVICISNIKPHQMCVYYTAKPRFRRSCLLARRSKGGERMIPSKGLMRSEPFEVT